MEKAQKCGWFGRHYVTIALLIVLLGAIPAFTPAVFKAKDLLVESGRLRGREEILNLPRARYETVSRSLKDFQETWKKGSAPSSEELASAFRCQWWAGKRIGMLQKYMSEQDQSANSPYETSYSAYRELHDMVKQLQVEADAYSAEIFARHSPKEIERAKAKFEYEMSFLEYHEPVSFFPLVLSLVGGYLALALWSGVYFIPKLKHNRFRLMPEIFSGRLLLAMLFCPIMFAVYPWGDPKQQLRMMLRNVASLASLLMCNAGPAGMTFAKNMSAQKRNTHPIAFVMYARNSQPGYSDKPEEVSAPPQKSPEDVATNSTAAVKPQTVSWSASTMLLPKYIGIAGGNFYDSPVLQTNVSAAFKNGLMWSVWTSKSMVSFGKQPNYGNEIAVSADYVKKWRGVSFSIGVTYDVVSPITDLPHGDVLQTRVGVGKSFKIFDAHTVTPHVLVRHFNPIKGSDPERGTFIQMGADHSFSFGKHRIDSTGEIVADTGAFRFVPQKVFKWGTDFNWHTGLGKLRVQLPVVRFSAPLGRDPVRIPQLLFGLGASW